jgi:hypothetical protein
LVPMMVAACLPPRLCGRMSIAPFLAREVGKK